MRTVILSDDNGQSKGSADLFEAHSGNGLLHLAFSVFVFRKQRTQTLIQRRAATKMLWAGVWANTCCSHPLEGEMAQEAGERRLREELGFSVPLTPLCSFVYHAKDPYGKGVEYEYDTILVGDIEEDITINPDPREVQEWKWIDRRELEHDMCAHPDKYAPWLHIGLPKITQ